MQKREFERYKKAEFTESSLVFFSPEENSSLFFDITDISLNGIGFKARDNSEDYLEFIETLPGDVFFINVTFEKMRIVCGVKNCWLTENADHLYTGGLKIEIISNEDNLFLSNNIEKFRKDNLLKNK